MFQYLIAVSPLGLMYGSAGAFLSPENLVGRSGAKFPPDAATLSGLFFSTNHATESSIASHEELTDKLHVAGPFWAKRDNPEVFYVPIPRHRIISLKDKNDDEWSIDERHRWQRDPSKKDKNIEPDCFWQSIDSWHRSTVDIRKNQEVKDVPWQYVSFLHPQMKEDERHTKDADGLFLENAVQMDEDYCLIYLSTYPLADGWYRFGGEGHLVEIESHAIDSDSAIDRLLNAKIQRSCALITPGVWGSNKLSHRYPKHPDFPKEGLKMLTDKAIPYRYRQGNRTAKKGGQLSRGRYAVPSGSVYVFKKPLELNWWDFPDEWFPEARMRNGEPRSLLKKVGCGLCLPVEIQGVN